MYPTLPFGPLALPTGPILAIFAVILALDVAGRYGRRLRLHPDDTWNVGMIAVTGGLIVARLWNVFQFWYIYQAEPLLIFSIRPGGFALWPGIIAALIGGYLYMLRRALDPARVLAALVVGAAAGSVILSISGYATGATLGARATVPWALPYLGELRHAVGLYQALGGVLLTALLWLRSDTRLPGRMVLHGILGLALIRLVSDAYLAEAGSLGGLRVSQIVALAVALVAALLLARPPAPPPATTAETTPDTVP
jgi:prolipoprotein diacylglyceryltransferase